MNRTSILRMLPVLALVFATVATPATAQSRSTTAKEQLTFGVEMAQRGLWSEALFRFRQAQELEPENPSVLNNLAVAHEALGLFEEALQLYREGLALSPQDRGLRNNYARFVDFYQRFKPDEEDDGEADDSQQETASDADSSQDPPEASAAAGIARRSTGVGDAVSSFRNRSVEVP